MLSRAFSQTYRCQAAFQLTGRLLRSSSIITNSSRRTQSLTRYTQLPGQFIRRKSVSSSVIQRFYSSKDTSDGNETNFNDSIYCSKCGNPFRNFKPKNSIYHSIKCDTCDITFLAIEKKYLPDAEIQEEQLLLDISKPLIEVPIPRKIHDRLDECVIGQSLTKQVLAVHVHSHYKRIQYNLEQEKKLNANLMKNKTVDIIKKLRYNSFIKTENFKELGKDALMPRDSSTKDSLFKLFSPESEHMNKPEDIELEKSNPWRESSPNLFLEKSNIIMIGPTGSGKTLMVQTLAKYLNVPIAICDCTSLTQAGFVGDDVESIIVRLYQLADYDVEKAQQGIIFLDEIDKISCSKFAYSTRDVTGEGVQQDLLKLLEGKIVTINASDPNSNRRSMRYTSPGTVTIDTRNILFIASGAFTKLEDIVKSRKHKQIFGFLGSNKTSNKEGLQSTSDVSSDEADILEHLAERDDLLKEIEVCDLVQYGMIPEFMGRFPIMTSLHTLSEDMMVDIMKTPKNAILKQFEQLFEVENCKLTITDDAIRQIAKQSISKDIGARGARSIIEKILLDALYEVPGSDICEVQITKEIVSQGLKPIFIRKSEQE